MNIPRGQISSDLRPRLFNLDAANKLACLVRPRNVGRAFAFRPGESIHTENSYKYDEASIRRIAEAGGFDVKRIWTDSRNWFADALLVVR